MKTELNFDNWLCRASSAHVLTTGTIGVTDIQEARIKELKNEEKTGINVNGNKVSWTENKKQELIKLVSEKENPTLPKTIQTELKKIYRSEKYDRSFPFTNKFVEKGLSQEEESFTTYQEWLQETKSIKTFLKNNKERLNNEFFTGETDSDKHFHNTFKYGFDIKTSFTIESFPFEDEPLDSRYQWQNQVYMELTGLEKWKTVYVLVNSNEDTLHREKSIWFYSCGMHRDDSNFDKYQDICKELEKKHIVDMDRFIYLNPGHDLVFTREEWHKSDLDIPLKDRVIEKTILKSDSDIEYLKNRILMFRKELNRLD